MFAFKKNLCIRLLVCFLLLSLCLEKVRNILPSVTLQRQFHGSKGIHVIPVVVLVLCQVEGFHENVKGVHGGGFCCGCGIRDLLLLVAGDTFAGLVFSLVSTLQCRVESFVNWSRFLYLLLSWPKQLTEEVEATMQREKRFVLVGNFLVWRQIVSSFVFGRAAQALGQATRIFMSCVHDSKISNFEIPTSRGQTTVMAQEEETANWVAFVLFAKTGSTPRK